MKEICCQISFWSVIGWSILAQQSAVDIASDAVYYKAIQLFNKQEYSASQAFLKQLEYSENTSLLANKDYYLAQTAIRLNQDNAEELMLHFIEKHPTHPKHNSAYFEVGNYYYAIGKYANAKKWYQDVVVEDLSVSEKETYYFNLGYSLYTSKRYTEAEKNLKKVKESEKYGSEANYYLGFISYKSDDYGQADTYFKEIKADSKLNKKLSYYKADKNFKQGKFELAIASAKEELFKSKPSNKSELNKIIGESYFNLKQYKEAIPYLELYKGKGGKWSNTDHYLLGYSYYKNGDYTKAVSRFNKIIGGNDAVAQNAYYHLADAYLRLNLKPQALNAFKNAYEMSYVIEIKKDAGYNYGKLSYELGNSFESVPAILRTYLVKYPNSVYREELSTLLVDSYITSKNYKEALEVLVIEKNEKNNKVHQKVLYLYGMELLLNTQIQEAIEHFRKAEQLSVLPLITQYAIFWQGEGYYKLANYTEAISKYSQLKENNLDQTLNLKHYQLGYSYFKLKQYEEAIFSLDSFLQLGILKKNYKLDATLRLADSYFASAKYWPAMENYNKAIALNHPKSDYAQFQKAISYGFVQRNEQKIKGLEQFLVDYKNSTFKDDALFALASVYVAEGNIKKGITTYQQLQNQLPNSPLVSKAVLKEGLIYYNKDQSEKAIERFKLVAEKYPKTAEALQAVKTARLVYIDLGQTQAYANWVNTLDFVQITNEDLDNTTYEAAEKPYLENNSAKAIANFETYLTQFSTGLHSLESHFYLAQLYTKQNKWENALSHYLYVTKQESSEFSETSIYRVSQIYLEQEKYAKAIPFLERLEKEADFEQNIIFAKTNLMKAYNQKKQYAKTIVYANGVLDNPKVEEIIKTDAQINKARAALALGKLDIAEKAYTKVSKTATGKIGAESVYYLAKFNTDAKKYEASNVFVQRLAKDFSAYRDYGAKSLLLMAKNFHGLGDAYQATYVLSSVTKNFKQYPKVIAEAKVLLEEIKAEEAKVNSSINE